MSKEKPDFTIWGNGKDKIIKGTKAVVGLVVGGVALGLGLKAANSINLSNNKS